MTLWLDRRLLYEVPWPLPFEPDARWRVAVRSSAVDTYVHVRNIAVWEGARYRRDRTERGG